MSSSSRPQVRKPYQNAVGVVTPPNHKPAVGHDSLGYRPAVAEPASGVREVKDSDLGLFRTSSGEVREAADNRKIFRIRVTRTGDHDTTYYHFRITFCGHVYVTPAFWSKKYRSGGTVVKLRSSQNKQEG